MASSDSEDGGSGSSQEALRARLAALESAVKLSGRSLEGVLEDVGKLSQGPGPAAKSREEVLDVDGLRVVSFEFRLQRELSNNSSKTVSEPLPMLVISQMLISACPAGARNSSRDEGCHRRC